MVAAWEKKLAIERDVFGSVSEEVARSLARFARMQETLNNFTAAQSARKEVLELRQKLHGDRDWRAAYARLALADSERLAGFDAARRARYWEAEKLGAAVVDRYKKGRYPEAVRLAQQVIAIRRDLLGKTHPAYAKSLNDLAGLYRDMGDYAKALPLFEETRAITQKALGTDHPNYAASLNNLALLYDAMGDYAQALPLSEEARAIFKKTLGTGHPDYAGSLNTLASLYQAMEAYAQALPLSEEARAITQKALGPDHPHYADSLHNLAALYQAMGAYASALPLYEEARALREKALGPDHPAYAMSLNNLAALYQAMGDYAKALPLYEEARAITQKALGTDHPAYATRLSNLAGLYQAMGQTREAATLLRQSLTVTRTFLDFTLTVQSDRQRLRFLAQQRVTLDAYLSVAPAAGLPAGPLYETVLAWKGTLAARQAEEYAARGRADLLPTLDRLRQARAGLARLYQQQPANAAQRADWLKRFNEFEARKEQLEVELAGASDTYRRFRELRAATAEQVAVALPPGTALVDFVQHTYLTPPPEGKGPVQRDERLLAFVLAPGRPPACIVLGPADPIARLVQAWRHDLPDRRRDPQRAGAALAQRLWAPLAPALAGASTVLIAPDGVVCGLPFAALPGKKPGTFLLEDVAIGYVTSGRHLLELAADNDRPAAAGLLALGGLTYGDSQTADTPPTLPDDLTRGRGWQPLPGTRLEAERVAARFCAARPDKGEARLLTGAEPDADHLRRELQPAEGRPRWRYLHLATHGFFDPPLPGEDPARRPKDLGPTFGEQREHLTYGRNPLLRCGLVLAGANRDPEHGFLSAEEVAGLDLGGCDLAVLSACETSLGKVADGEGMLGLQRAFQAAGAHSLAASLWGVSDPATSVLMEEFYANLWEKKLPKLEALRQAQLTVLRHPEKVEQRAKELRALLGRGPGKEAGELPDDGRPAPGQARRSPPAWWAAFILSGDTQ
jgi:CHAT domain-containing protein